MSISIIVTIGILLVWHVIKVIRKTRRADQCFVGTGKRDNKEICITSFPRSWSIEKASKKIVEAQNNIIEKSSRKILGITTEGIVIQIYLKDNTIIHAFPPKIYNT